jgi:hypothetical protein
VPEKPPTDASTHCVSPPVAPVGQEKLKVGTGTATVTVRGADPESAVIVRSEDPPGWAASTASVSVAVAGAADVRETCGGAIPHVNPAAALQANATVPVNPPAGVNVQVADPVVPGPTLSVPHDMA